MTVLPPVFGPGHDERGVAVAEADVDRDHATAEAGMAGAQQDDLGAVGGLRPDPVHLGGELRLGRPEVEPGERVERVAERFRVGGDQRRELVEDPLDLLLLGRLRLPPRIAELDGDHRLHEQRLAAARGVVDDPLDAAAGLRLDRDHVAAVAERDDRLLERAAQLRADERVEPPPETVVGDADGGAQATETRRRGVEQLSDRVEAAGQRRPDRRQGMELAGERVEQRPAVVGERRLEAGGGVERVGDLEELLGVEASAACRPLNRRADVVRCPDPDARPLGQQRARLVGLVEASGDDHRVGRWLERRGQPLATAGTARVAARRSRTSGNSSSAIERVSIVVRRERSGAGRRRHGCRRPRTATGRPPTALRRRRCRSAGSRRRQRGGRPSAPCSSRSGEAGSSRSRPVIDRSIENAAATRPGPRARSCSGRRSRRARSRDSASGAAAERRARHQRGSRVTHRRRPVERLDRADEDRRGPSLGLGHDVQAVVHPVDKVHVGPTRGPVHDGVARGPPEPRVRRPILLADVRLDLDDATRSPAGAGFAVADEAQPDQRRSDLEGRPVEERPEIAQDSGVGVAGHPG